MEATMRDTLGDDLFSAAEARGRTRPIEVLAVQAPDSRKWDESSS
jgi:hypothetical protein